MRAACSGLAGLMSKPAPPSEAHTQASDEPARRLVTRVGTVFQQLHNYSVAAGNAGIKPEFALGRKNHQVFEVNGSLGSLSFNLERLNELQVDLPGGPGGFTDVLVTDAKHPFMQYWWPTGHIIGWEHTFVHEIAHLFDAIVNDRDVAPYGATFEDGYRAAVVCDAIATSARERKQVLITY